MPGVAKRRMDRAGLEGFEPSTAGLRVRCSTWLSHRPGVRCGAGHYKRWEQAASPAYGGRSRHMAAHARHSTLRRRQGCRAAEPGGGKGAGKCESAGGCRPWRTPCRNWAGPQHLGGALPSCRKAGMAPKPCRPLRRMAAPAGIRVKCRFPICLPRSTPRPRQPACRRTVAGMRRLARLRWRAPCLRGGIPARRLPKPLRLCGQGVKVRLVLRGHICKPCRLAPYPPHVPAVLAEPL